MFTQYAKAAALVTSLEQELDAILGKELDSARVRLLEAARTVPPELIAPSSGPDPVVLGLGIGGGLLAVGLIVGIIVGVTTASSGDGGVDLMGPTVRW